MNVQLTLSFYSSAMFANEAVFISEQITDHTSRMLLETYRVEGVELYMGWMFFVQFLK